MKKIIAFICLITLIACSPKLRTNISQSLPALSENELVAVLDIADFQDISADKIGEIRAVDNGFSENCTYYENVENLKRIARASGANLIKITKKKTPDKWSSCHRLWANIYRVEDPKIYESQIEWSPDRKLTWNDFKGQPDQINYPNALALTNSGFGYESGISLFKEGKLFIRSVFNTQNSWVLPEGRTDYVLRHEQIHFDITEIYSRMLRKALSEAKITASNANRAQPIFDKIFNDLQKRQEKYDRETQLGSKELTQENWEAIVEIELAKYDFYKDNN